MLTGVPWASGLGDLRVMTGMTPVVTTTAWCSKSCKALSGAKSEAFGMKLMTASKGEPMLLILLKSMGSFKVFPPKMLSRLKVDERGRTGGRPGSGMLFNETPDVDLLMSNRGGVAVPEFDESTDARGE